MYEFFNKSVLFDAADEGTGGGGETTTTETSAGSETTDVETSDDATDDEEETSEETDSSDDLSDDEKANAVRIYQVLKDPSLRLEFIKQLAEQNGLSPTSTKTERTEAKAETKKNIRDLITQKLGPDGKFLAGILGDVLEEVFQAKDSEINEKFHEYERRETEKQVRSAYNRLNKETKGESAKLESRMAELSKDFPPGQGVDVYRYIRSLYVLASDGSKKNGGNVTDLVNRIKKNATDTPTRIKSAGGKPSSAQPEPKTRREAIELAAKNLGINT